MCILLSLRLRLLSGIAGHPAAKCLPAGLSSARLPSAQLPPARLPLGDLILLRQARVLEEEFCEQSKQCGLVFDFGRATTTAIATGAATTTSTTALTGCTLADASDA